MIHYIVVDHSGSMRLLWPEVSDSLNGYIGAIPAKDDVVIRKFSGEGRNTIQEMTKAYRCPTIAHSQYRMFGLTPLFDAIGTAAEEILEENPDRAALMIYTDGLENMSSKYNVSALAELVETLESKGYVVQFIGCDFRDLKDAQAINAGHVSVSKGSFGEFSTQLASQNTAYSRGVDYKDMFNKDG